MFDLETEEYSDDGEVVVRPCSLNDNSTWCPEHACNYVREEELVVSVPGFWGM